MAEARSPITSEIDFEAEGKQTGFLRLPHSVHRSAYGWIPIPIAQIKNGEGPTLLLISGNHGDEYEGQVALTKLIQKLDPDMSRSRRHANTLPARSAARPYATLRAGDEKSHGEDARPRHPPGGRSGRVALRAGMRALGRSAAPVG